MGRGSSLVSGADVAAGWAVNVVTCRCGTYVDELEHSFRLLAVLLLLKLLPDLRDASDAPKPTNNKQQHRVAVYPGWLLPLHAALLVDAAQSRNTPYPARKSDPAVARPAHVYARRQASAQGRKHVGAHLLMYCDSFFLLARMPLTISANDFSNMAAV